MRRSSNEKTVSSAATATMSGCEMVPQIESLLFTKAQAAEMLNLSEASINWLLRKGAIPHRKIAGKIRFTRSDLEALIEASAVTQCCAAEQKGV